MYTNIQHVTSTVKYILCAISVVVIYVKYAYSHLLCCGWCIINNVLCSNSSVIEITKSCNCKSGVMRNVSPYLHNKTSPHDAQVVCTRQKHLVKDTLSIVELSSLHSGNIKHTGIRSNIPLPNSTQLYKCACRLLHLGQMHNILLFLLYALVPALACGNVK